MVERGASHYQKAQSFARIFQTLMFSKFPTSTSEINLELRSLF